MTKKDALKKIAKLSNENAKDFQSSEIIWQRIETRKYRIEKLKRDYNIGNTFLDDTLLNFYRSKSKAMAL